MAENTVYVSDNRTKRSVRYNNYHLREKSKGNLHVIFDVLVLVATQASVLKWRECQQIKEPFGICHLNARHVTTCQRREDDFLKLGAF
jgi:hypothetical protein